MSINPTSPADIFGGTWEALEDGRVLIGAGSAHPAGEEGGAEEVALALAEIPSHNHSLSVSGSTKSAGSHSHSRGDMNITAGLEDALMDVARGTGAFSVNTTGTSPYGGDRYHLVCRQPQPYGKCVRFHWIGRRRRGPQ